MLLSAEIRSSQKLRALVSIGPISRALATGTPFFMLPQCSGLSDNRHCGPRFLMQLVYVGLHAYVSIYEYVCASACVCMYVCLSVCMHVFMYVFMHVCIHVYIYIYM